MAVGCGSQRRHTDSEQRPICTSIALLRHYMPGSVVITADSHGSTLVTAALQPPKAVLMHPKA
jgi:hypothetical protein